MPKRVLRIFLHDFPGHPSHVQLSRALARRGHQVLHAFSTMVQSPKGTLVKQSYDPSTFDVLDIGIGEVFQKHSYVKRQFQEFTYGCEVVKAMQRFQPDVVIGSNTPLVPLEQMRRMCQKEGIPFVFWMMDVYGLAVRDGLAKKSRLIGEIIGGAYILLEKYICHRSDEIVVIAESFQDLLLTWGADPARLDCMPLWGPLDQIDVGSKDNSWSRQHGLDQTINLVYAGTLGLKHNPQALVSLAEACRGRTNVRVIVVSDGLGANFLKEQKGRLQLDNLLLLPFQPFHELPNIFAAATVLLALLEAEAGAFSVPSKILSHLCSGRPQVALLPAENRATKVIEESGGGVAIRCGDVPQFVEKVLHYIDNPDTASEAGRKARAYAEREFNIDRIAEVFEGMIMKPFDRDSRF